MGLYTFRTRRADGSVLSYSTRLLESDAEALAHASRLCADSPACHEVEVSEHERRVSLYRPAAAEAGG